MEEIPTENREKYMFGDGTKANLMRFDIFIFHRYTVPVSAHIAKIK